MERMNPMKWHAMDAMNNLTLHTDKYQINMMYAHWLQGTHTEKAVFEVYFRKLPFDGGYAVFAGLERVIHYVQSLHFGEEEIAYLREQEENYKEEFLDALRAFTFKGDIQAIPEGTLVFPECAAGSCHRQYFRGAAR